MKNVRQAALLALCAGALIVAATLASAETGAALTLPEAGPGADAGALSEAGPGADAGALSETGALLSDGGLSERRRTLHSLEHEDRWLFVDKSERLMVVHDRGRYEESFRIALGFTPLGDKELEGDGRTPEGEFYVCHRFHSDRFNRFLGLSYPGPEDGERGAHRGLVSPLELRVIKRAFRHRIRPPWNTKLGGNVGIHGWGRRAEIEDRHNRREDWTDGCLGVTNDEIDRIYPHARLGTRVVIVP